MSFLNPHATTPLPLIVPMPDLEIRMEVVFGTPSKNCEGSGICMLAYYPHAGFKGLRCPKGIAHVSVTPAKSLQFRFLKAEQADARGRAHFEGGCFLVEEPFYIPRKLVRQWGLPSSWAAPGRYPVWDKGDMWSVQIEVSV